MNVILISAGSILLMWIGELATEYGIGNGVSIIIFAGIVAGLPTTISQLAFSLRSVTAATVPRLWFLGTVYHLRGGIHDRSRATSPCDLR